jgi:hypothetical protein
MHRASSRTIPRIAIGLVAVLMAVAGLSMAVLGSVPSAHTAASVPQTHAGALTRGAGEPLAKSSAPLSTAAAPPAPPTSYNNTTAYLVVDPIAGRYNAVPLQVFFNVSVQVNISGTWTWENSSLTSSTTMLYFTIQDAVTSYTQSNVTIPVVAGQTAYSVWIDDQNLSCPSIDPTCQSISDPYYVTFFTVVDLTGAPFHSPAASSASSSLSTPDGFVTFVFLTQHLSLTPISPLSSTVPLGNVTFSASYTGQFIFIANLTVFSPTVAKLVIFYANMLKSPSGTPASALWTPAAAGAYPISWALVTIYGASIYLNSTLTVKAAGGGNVYTNTTTWHNGTGVLGLSAAVGGTTLLLVGLIVGMIVAFLLGRAVTSRAPSQPAQAWSGTTAPAANTCSTCGRTFATPEELAAHSKSEHGM